MRTLPPEGNGLAFGEFLRHARERRGLTLQQLSNETKIPFRHLDALEHGNLAAVPAGPYRRGEIRAYAQAVHLDQNLALAELERALDASTTCDAATSDTQGNRERRRSQGPAVVAIGVVAAVALVGLGMWNRPPADDSGARARYASDTGQVRVVTPAAPGLPTALENAAPSRTDAAAVAHEQEPALRDTAPAPQATSDPLAEASEAGIAQTAPPSTAPDGELVVTTEPAGARVTVNGIGWGVTPLTIRNLPPGVKRIRVTKAGYDAEERVVRVAEDRPTSPVRIPLRSVP